MIKFNHNVAALGVGLLLMLGSWGCASGPKRTASPAEPLIQKIVVLPFQIPPDIADTKTCLRCPICGRSYRSGPVAPIAGQKMTRYLMDRLKKYDAMTIMGTEAGEKAPLPLTACDLATGGGIESLIHIGQSHGADGLMIGYIFRFEDRQGFDYAAKMPASVAFDLHLICIQTGEVIWQETFDETQAPLSENLFNIDTFIQRKGRWVSADEMAAEGLADLLDTHMEP